MQWRTLAVYRPVVYIWVPRVYIRVYIWVPRVYIGIARAQPMDMRSKQCQTVPNSVKPVIIRCKLSKTVLNSVKQS